MNNVEYFKQDSKESRIISRRRKSNEEELLDFIELTKLVEDLGNDQMLRHNNIRLIRDFTTDVNVEKPQIYSSTAAASQQQQHMCLSTLCNKNDNVRSPSQIPVLRGHVDIECCYCFHKQKALEQKEIESKSYC